MQRNTWIWNSCEREREIRQFVSFQCICPIIDNEFRHNIVKVVCGSTRLSPRGSTATLTWSITGQTHKNWRQFDNLKTELFENDGVTAITWLRRNRGHTQNTDLPWVKSHFPVGERYSGNPTYVYYIFFRLIRSLVDPTLAAFIVCGPWQFCVTQTFDFLTEFSASLNTIQNDRWLLRF